MAKQIYDKHAEGMPWHPWSVQLEPVQGCNRRCWFCGIIGVPEEKREPVSFMPLDVLAKAYSDLNEWLPKVRTEINLHGEPTLHPQWLEFLATIRENMPSSWNIVQTNCEPWRGEGIGYIDKMFAAGADCIVLNAYEKGLYGKLKQLFDELRIPYIDLFHNNPDKLSYYRYEKPARGKKRLFLLDSLGEGDTRDAVSESRMTSKRLHNSGGASRADIIAKKTNQKVVQVPTNGKCSKVFRELIINWDGLINVCCLDWNDEKIIGDVRQKHIRDIWFSERYTAIRNLLWNRHRDLLTPCMGCDDPTTRVGLVPKSDLIEIERTDEALEIVERTEQWMDRDTYGRVKWQQDLNSTSRQS